LLFREYFHIKVRHALQDVTYFKVIPRVSYHLRIAKEVREQFKCMTYCNTLRVSMHTV